METRKTWLSENLKDPDFRREYYRERAVLDYLFDLEKGMSSKGITRSMLANRVGCSAANVSRALQKDANLTVGTMVDYALATGMYIRVQALPLSTAFMPTTSPDVGAIWSGSTVYTAGTDAGAVAGGTQAVLWSDDTSAGSEEAKSDSDTEGRTKPGYTLAA